MSRLRRGSIIEQKGIGLPREYQEVEYLESTGTQYIDTGITPTTSNKYRYVAKIIPLYNGGYDMGNLNCDLRISFGFYVKWVTAWDSWFYNSPFVVGQAYIVDLTLRDGYQIVHINNDVYTNSYRIGSERVGFELSIFCLRTGVTSHDYFMQEKKYACSFYENDILVRSFIPSYRISDSKPCMYDLVSQQPFFNQGTGVDFILGPDV